MDTVKTRIRLTNDCNTDISHIKVTGVEDEEWGAARPDKLFNSVQLSTRNKIQHEVDVNQFASTCSYNVCLTYTNGLIDYFKLNQKAALGHNQDFQHFVKTHNVTCHIEGNKTLVITVTETKEQSDARKIDEIHDEAEKLLKKQQYKQAIATFITSLIILNQQPLLRTKEISETRKRIQSAQTLHGKGKELMKHGKYNEATIQFDEALKVIKNQDLNQRRTSFTEIKQQAERAENILCEVELSIQKEMYKEITTTIDKILMRQKVSISNLKEELELEKKKKVVEKQGVSKEDHERALKINSLGAIALKKGKYGEAVSYFSEALQIAPSEKFQNDKIKAMQFSLQLKSAQIANKEVELVTRHEHYLKQVQVIEEALKSLRTQETKELELKKLDVTQQLDHEEEAFLFDSTPVEKIGKVIEVLASEVESRKNSQEVISNFDAAFVELSKPSPTLRTSRFKSPSIDKAEVDEMESYQYSAALPKTIQQESSKFVSMIKQRFNVIEQDEDSKTNKRQEKVSKYETQLTNGEIKIETVTIKQETYNSHEKHLSIDNIKPSMKESSRDTTKIVDHIIEVPDRHGKLMKENSVEAELKIKQEETSLKEQKGEEEKKHFEDYRRGSRTELRRENSVREIKMKLERKASDMKLERSASFVARKLKKSGTEEKIVVQKEDLEVEIVHDNKPPKIHTLENEATNKNTPPEVQEAKTFVTITTSDMIVKPQSVKTLKQRYEQALQTHQVSSSFRPIRKKPVPTESKENEEVHTPAETIPTAKTELKVKKEEEIKPSPSKEIEKVKGSVKQLMQLFERNKSEEQIYVPRKKAETKFSAVVQSVSTEGVIEEVKLNVEPLEKVIEKEEAVSFVKSVRKIFEQNNENIFVYDTKIKKKDQKMSLPQENEPSTTKLEKSSSFSTGDSKILLISSKYKAVSEVKKENHIIEEVKDELLTNESEDTKDMEEENTPLSSEIKPQLSVSDPWEDSDEEVPLRGTASGIQTQASVKSLKLLFERGSSSRRTL